MLYRMEEGHPPHETPPDGEFWVEDWFTNQDLRFFPVEPCEHGAIERHPVYADDAVEGDDGFEWSIFEKWCEGAALNPSVIPIHKEGT